MTYLIRGLEPGHFAHYFAMDERELQGALARRLVAGEAGRYPCRVSLQDARPGDELVLANFTSHAVETPYRHSFAIYVRKDAGEAAEFVDSIPPVLRHRAIALRGYDRGGSLRHAAIALDDDVDAKIRELLEHAEIAYIDAHNAMHGCFAARVERYSESGQ